MLNRCELPINAVKNDESKVLEGGGRETASSKRLGPKWDEVRSRRSRIASRRQEDLRRTGRS